MTLVVTHTEGFLGCFTTEPDGSLRQRALIDTGTEPHTPLQLAELGTILAEQWGWSLNGYAPVKKVAPAQKKALPAQQKKPRAYTQPTETITERYRLIQEYLAEHPDSTLMEILEGVGQPATHVVTARWYHQMKALVSNGTISYRTRSAMGHPKEYRLI